jgi:hypothetical protein
VFVYHILLQIGKGLLVANEVSVYYISSRERDHYVILASKEDIDIDKKISKEL